MLPFRFLIALFGNIAALFSVYKQPDATSDYLQPDGTSLYLTP